MNADHKNMKAPNAGSNPPNPWATRADFLLIGALVVFSTLLVAGDLGLAMMAFVLLMFSGLLCGGMEHACESEANPLQGEADELAESEEVRV